jgi:hypothetical protein
MEAVTMSTTSTLSTNRSLKSVQPHDDADATQGVELSPETNRPDSRRWAAVACGAAAAIGVAWAAAFVTVRGVERDVGIAAWVAAAVVGASATISAAGPGHHRWPRLARRLRRLENKSESHHAEIPTDQ